jgi:hypothetical protein
MKHSVKFGIIGGLSAIVITVLFYVTGLNLSSMWGAAISGLLMMVVFGVVAVLSVKEERAANGGAISFKSAFINGFVCLFVAFVISSIYSYIHYNFVEPEFFDKLAEMLATKLAEYQVPADKIEQQVNDILKKKETIRSFDYKSALGGLAFAAVYSLIIAAILKKEKMDDYAPIS